LGSHVPTAPAICIPMCIARPRHTCVRGEKKRREVNRVGKGEVKTRTKIMQKREDMKRRQIQGRVQRTIAWST